MPELTKEELGKIALKVMTTFNDDIPSGTSAERATALRTFGAYYIAKEAGIANEKAVQFLQKIDGLASDLNEKEAEEIALSFLGQRFPRYLKIQNVDRFSHLAAERTGIPSEMLARFTQQLLAQ